MTDEEFNELLKGYDFKKAGEGDSPYTQELLDELNGKTEEKEAER